MKNARFFPLLILCFCIPSLGIATEVEDRDKLLKEEMIVSGVSSTVFWGGLLAALGKQIHTEATSDAGLQMGTFGRSPWNSVAIGILTAAGLSGAINYLTSMVGSTWFWSEYGADIDAIDGRYKDMSNSYFVDVAATALVLTGGASTCISKPAAAKFGKGIAGFGGGLLAIKRFLDVRNFWAWVVD